MASVRNMPRQQQKAVFARMGNPTFRENSQRDKILRKEFPNESGLNYSASIFVPSTFRDKPIPKKLFAARISRTKDFLNKSFGGSTTVRSVGSYTDSKSVLINEDIAIVTAHTDRKGYSKGSKKVEGFLKKKRKAWNQESMGYAFESPEKPSKSFHFVE